MSNIIAINPLEVPAERAAEALEIWDRIEAVMRRQPGFIGVTLHQSLSRNARFHLVAVAQWESPDHFVQMVNNAEIKEAGKGFGAFPHYPALYQVVRG